MIYWDDLRFFLAVTRHKTLASAAKQLQVTQSTVRRRLAAFQDDLGVRLLSRSADGYVTTPAGEIILSHIERVEAEALSVQRVLTGFDTRIGGVVRMAGPELLTNHLLPPIIATLHTEHPEIVIETVAETDVASPSLADADLVIRLRRFDNLSLVVRNIGTVAFGLYGSLEYLAQRPAPDFGTGCVGTRLITLLEEQAVSAQSAWLNENAPGAAVVFRSDSYDNQQSVARCGCGLAVLPRYRADPDPSLRQLCVPVPIPPSNIWIGVHRDSRMLPRVRLVLDRVAASLRSRSDLAPEHAASKALDT